MEGSPTPEKLMNACPSCGEVVDVTACAPFSKVICPNCGQAIRVRTDFHHFTIRRQIGEGGMSRVFEAEDQTLGRKVALKILNPQFSQDVKRIRGFEKEARMTASIQHPNVVSVYSVDSDQGQLFIAMELVPGGNLDDKIFTEKKLSEFDVLEIGLRIAEGLNAAHSLGLIHRDIKPGNILFSDNGEPKLVDFGLALMFERDVDEEDEIWATPFYVPPEKLLKKPEDFRSDIYSLGATLYHAAVGRPPFDAKSSSLEELKAIKDKDVNIADAAPWLSKETCRLINRMMARSPEDRPESYDDLLENIRFAKQNMGLGGLAGAGVNRVVIWGALAVLSVAVAAVSIWSALEDKGDDNGGSAPIVGEGGINPGEGRTIARRFVAARKAMVNGKVGAAAEEFKNIATSPEVKQPTLNWSRFNLGIGELMKGRVSAANRWFELLEVPGGEEDEAVLFLGRLGERLTDPLPVLNEERSSFEASPYRGIAWLAFALKNWQHGEFREAAMFLKAFGEERPVMTEKWIEDYRPLLRPFEEDLKWLNKEPVVSRDSTLVEVEKARSEMEGIRKRLRTAGAAPEFAEARLERLNQRVAYLEELKKEERDERLGQLYDEERERIEKLRADLGKLEGDERFTEAVELIDGQKFEHPRIQTELEKVGYIWKTSELFIRTLIEDLDTHVYEGLIETGTGSAATVKVTGASLEDGISFQYNDPVPGQSSISIGNVAPKSLLDMAIEMAMKDPDMDEHIKRLEYIAVFAYQIGETETALGTAEELSRYAPAFKERWRQVISERADS